MHREERALGKPYCGLLVYDGGLNMERDFLPRPEVIGHGTMALNRKRVSLDWAQRNFLGLG